jgi:bifunctional non-homologous end joining protein LigD
MMERYPAGIGEKDSGRGRSKVFEWLQRRGRKKDGVVHHPVLTDARSLLWMTNQNTITQHVSTSRIPHLNYPDMCVFDLDPSNDDAEAVRAAAIALRDLLEELTLPSWVKTSGSKGFHIVVPLDGDTTVGQVARFANTVGTVFVSRAADRLTQEFSKADRRGRIYVDTGQRLQRHVYGGVHACANCPGVGSVHVEEIERAGESPHVHPAKHARSHRDGWRYGRTCGAVGVR